MPSCSFAVTEYEGKNALELGIGSKACETEGRADDAAFLEVLARIRFSADLLLIPPDDLLELSRNTDFAAVFSDRKEFVEEGLARDPERFAALVDRVREADLSIPAEYDPGWAVRDDEKRALYAEVIDGLRTDTLVMESYVAKLVRDDAYFSAYLERVAMLADLPANGGQLPERFDEATELMRTRMDVLGDPPTTTAVPWRKVYEPAPSAPFTMLYRGFNGPAQSDALIFRSPAEVRQSWVGKTLSEGELTQVLSRIDFDNEILGVYAVGERFNATENVFVTEFGPEQKFEGYSINVRVGVVGKDCGLEPKRSYPFVLVKASSKTDGDLTSSSVANYPDQCVSVMAGRTASVADPN